jgi:hypothetical protein
MATTNLTVANAVIFLVVPDIFPVPQQLQGFAADDLMTNEPVDSIETVMGLDGQLSAGWVPTPKIWTCVLQANSASTFMFDAWQQTQEAQKRGFSADGTITYPDLGRTFVMTNGFMTNYSVMPDARKILQPRRFRLTWESIVGAPI